MTLTEIAARWELIAGIVTGVGSAYGWWWLRKDKIDERKEKQRLHESEEFERKRESFNNRIMAELDRLTDSNNDTLKLLKHCQDECAARDAQISELRVRVTDLEIRLKKHEP